MNIFHLHEHWSTAASWHCDKHLSKMILEHTQLLCTAHQLLDDDPSPLLYKKTHVNHPSAVWVRQSSSNYNYLWLMTNRMNDIFRAANVRDHKSWQKLKMHLISSPDRIPNGGLTRFACAMKDEYKLFLNPTDNDQVVANYRNYYNLAKSSFAKWERYPTTQPYWYKPGELYVPT